MRTTAARSGRSAPDRARRHGSSPASRGSGRLPRSSATRWSPLSVVVGLIGGAVALVLVVRHRRRRPPFGHRPCRSPVGGIDRRSDQRSRRVGPGRPARPRRAPGAQRSGSRVPCGVDRSVRRSAGAHRRAVDRGVRVGAAAVGMGLVVDRQTVGRPPRRPSASCATGSDQRTAHRRIVAAGEHLGPHGQPRRSSSPARRGHARPSACPSTRSCTDPRHAVMPDGSCARSVDPLDPSR